MGIWTCENTNKIPRAHRPKDMRLWGRKDTNKYTGYMSLRRRKWEDTRLQASTHEPQDITMQVCKQGHRDLTIWGCKDARIQASAHTQTHTHTHTHEKIWRCMDPSKGTWIWGQRIYGCEDIKQVHMNIRIWGYGDARIQASAQEPKDMRLRGYF